MSASLCNWTAVAGAAGVSENGYSVCLAARRQHGPMARMVIESGERHGRLFRGSREGEGCIPKFWRAGVCRLGRKAGDLAAAGLDM